jgi:hypothetical protein
MSEENICAEELFAIVAWRYNGCWCCAFAHSTEEWPEYRVKLNSAADLSVYVTPENIDSKDSSHRGLLLNNCKGE